MQDPMSEPDLDWLRRLAGALVREPHAADDLAQDAWLAASSSAGAIERPRAWLGTVLRRLAARRVRAERRRARREREAARNESLPDSSALLERAEIAEKVARAVRSLEEPFRTTVLAHYLDDVSIAELARREGRPADTVRWRLRQGLERLRERLLRDGGGDWSHWSVALLSLAHSATGVGNVAGGAAADSVGSALDGALRPRVMPFLVGSWIPMTMKTTAMSFSGVLLLACMLVVGGGWFGGDARTVSGPADDAAALASRSSGSEARRTGEPLVESIAVRRALDEAAELAAREARSVDPRPAVRALVVDPFGRPIEDALVEWVGRAKRVEGESAAGTGANAEPDAAPGAFAASRTDARGFADLGRDFAERMASFGLVATAEGWLRTAIPGPIDAEPTDAGSPRVLTVVLKPGTTLRGRVVDRRGQPLAGIEVVATTLGAGVGHVSPSSVRWRIDRRNQDIEDRSFQSSSGKTGSDGQLALPSVPPSAELEIRCVDPGWRLVDNTRLFGDAPFVEWIAEEVLGVRVTAIDPTTGRPVPASATFSAEIELANGERLDVGSWVGRGAEAVSFSLLPELYPPLATLDGRSVTFYGTVSTRLGGSDWRAEPLPFSGARGARDVRIEIRPAPAGVRAVAMRTVVGTFDVQVDGVAFTGDLDVRWQDGAESVAAGGQAVVTRVSPGSYRAEFELPRSVVEVVLSVQERGASGSVPAWTTRTSVQAIPTRPYSIDLPESGVVTILRPAGWSGEWFVHASYRAAEGAPWNGSWTYSTSEERLVLRQVLPAEWRLALRPTSLVESGESQVLAVRVGPGDDLFVGG
jgi:RNA polymerase sigma-70 factor (ECF subfamily)